MVLRARVSRLYVIKSTAVIYKSSNVRPLADYTIIFIIIMIILTKPDIMNHDPKLILTIARAIKVPRKNRKVTRLT